MIQSFDPRQHQIIVEATLHGPVQPVAVRLLLDTGAAFTQIRPGLLARAGLALDAPRNHIRIAALNSVGALPLHVVDGLTAFGHRASRLVVLAHALPAVARVDGLLGVNFLRGHRLLLDFRDGVVRFDDDG